VPLVAICWLPMSPLVATKPLAAAKPLVATKLVAGKGVIALCLAWLAAAQLVLLLLLLPLPPCPLLAAPAPALCLVATARLARPALLGTYHRAHSSALRATA
jgi:hypothetical protein